MRNLAVPEEARKFLVAHFLRLVHPLNMFLSPKRGYEKNIVCKDIGEYNKLINYVYQHNKDTYQSIFKEYLSLIMVDENILFYCDGKDMIDCEYGLCKNESTKTTKEKEIKELENEIDKLKKKMELLKEREKNKGNLHLETSTKFEIRQLETIQVYIKRLLRILYSDNLLTTIDLERLQDKEYCKKKFGINYPLLITDYRKLKDATGCNRYWVNYMLANKYYVCSQWWKNDFDLYKFNIYKWVEEKQIGYLPYVNSRGLCKIFSNTNI